MKISEPKIKKLVSAYDRLYALDEEGRLWESTGMFSEWKEINKPEHVKIYNDSIVEFSVTFENFTTNNGEVVCTDYYLHVLTRGGSLFWKNTKYTKDQEWSPRKSL